MFQDVGISVWGFGFRVYEAVRVGGLGFRVWD